MQRPGNKNKFGMFTRNSRVRAAVMRWTGRKQVTSGPVDHGKEFGFFFFNEIIENLLHEILSSRDSNFNRGDRHTKK